MFWKYQASHSILHIVSIPCSKCIHTYVISARILFHLSRGTVTHLLNSAEIPPSPGITSSIFPSENYSFPMSYLWSLFIFLLYWLIHLFLPLDPDVFKNRDVALLISVVPLMSTASHAQWWFIDIVGMKEQWPFLITCSSNIPLILRALNTLICI